MKNKELSEAEKHFYWPEYVYQCERGEYQASEDQFWLWLANAFD